MPSSGYRVSVMKYFTDAQCEITAYLDNCNFEKKKWLGKLFEGLPTIISLSGKHIYSVKTNINVNHETFRRLIENFSMKKLNQSFLVNDFNNAFALFCYGADDIIFAYISTSGKIFFIDVACQHFYDVLGKDEFETVIADIFEFREQAVLRYDKSKIEKGEADGTLRSDTADSIAHKLAVSLPTDRKITEEMITRVIDESVSALVDPESSSPMSHRILLARNEFYRLAIKDYLLSNDKLKSQAFNDGFNVGLTFVNVLRKVGYEVEGEYFVKHPKWVPSKCCHDGTIYILPAEHPYTIKKLMIPVNCVKPGRHIQFLAVGNHPNVNGGKTTPGGVCLGSYHPKELTIGSGGKFNEQQFMDALIGAETTIKMINFDSSYKQLSSSLSFSEMDKESLSYDKTKKKKIRKI